MAITILEEPSNPCFSKNVIVYKVTTTTRLAVIGRLFVETSPYSEEYEFVTDIKSWPDSSGICNFYLHDLLEEDILQYDRPTFQAVQVLPNTCRRFRMDFFENDPSALSLHDEGYQSESSAPAAVQIDPLVASDNYIIILETNSYNDELTFELAANNQNATFLFSLGDEQWYELTANHAYDTIILAGNVKASLYKGIAPDLTSSSVRFAIIAGGVLVPPPKADDLALVSVGSTMFLFWESDKVDHYEIYRKSDGEYALVDTTKERYLIDSFLEIGTTYTYKVISVQGTKSESAEIAATATVGGPQYSILEDDFNDNSINTSKWTVTNTRAPAAQVSETNGQLELATDGSYAGNPFDCIVTSNVTFSSGTVQALVHHSLNPRNSNYGVGIWVDSDNHAVIQSLNATNETSLRVRIVSGGVTELDIDTAIDASSPVLVRVSIDNLNNIKFEYYDSGWTQIGTTEIANLGTIKKAVIYTGGTIDGNPSKFVIDDVYIYDSNQAPLFVHYDGFRGGSFDESESTIFEDNFDDNSIDISKWTVANTRTPAAQISETNGQLELTTDGSYSGNPFDCVITSDEEFSAGIIEANITHFQNPRNTNYGFGIWVDTNNHAIFQSTNADNPTSFRIRIKSAGVAVYDINTNIDASSPILVRVSIDSANNIQFKYYDGGVWTQMGSTQIATLGASKRIAAYTSGTQDMNPSKMIVDNVKLIDTQSSFWQITNIRTPAAQVSETNGQLELTTDGSYAGNPFDCIVTSNVTFSSGTVQALVHHSLNPRNSNYGVGIWVDSDNHAVIQSLNATNETSLRIRIVTGGVTELDVDTAIDASNPVLVRVSIDDSNNIKFEHYDAGWTQIGTTVIANLGTDKKATIYTGGTMDGNPSKFVIDDLIITNNIGYVSKLPVSPPTDEEPEESILFNAQDQFVVAELGQSNMEGRDGDSPLHTVPVGTAYEFDGTNIIHLVNDRGDGVAIDGSHATYYAAYISANSGGKKPVMVEVAKGGAALSSDTDSGNGNWGASGTLRGLAQSKINAALTANGTNSLIALWCQGEREAQEIDSFGYTKSQAKARMQEVIDWWFALYPNSKFLISVTGRPNSADTNGFNQIREMQEEIALENENVYIGFSGAVNFPAAGKMIDELHYNYLGYKDMGEALAAKTIEVWEA